MSTNKQLMTIADVNQLSYEDFIGRFYEIVEHGNLVAAAVWSYRPFSSVDELQDKFATFLDELPIAGTTPSTQHFCSLFSHKV